MSFVGHQLGGFVRDLSWSVVYVSLVALYVLDHDLFVSQTGRLLALFRDLMGVAVI